MNEDISWFERWWRSPFIMIEAARWVGNREVAALPYNKYAVPGFTKKGYAIRAIHAKSSYFLQQAFDTFNFWARAEKLYTSLALFSEIPTFSRIYQIRAKETKIWSKNIIENLKVVQGIDALFDIDSKDAKEGHRQAKILYEILNKFDIKFSIFPSGGKLGGWQARIRWEQFRAAGIKWKDVLRFNYLFSLALKYKLGAQDTDCGLFDIRRVGKMCMSLVYGENSHWNVCLPLREQQFLDFKPEDAYVENVWQNEQLKFRGLVEIGKGSNPQNIKKLMAEITPIGGEIEKELKEKTAKDGE